MPDAPEVAPVAPPAPPPPPPTITAVATAGEPPDRPGWSITGCTVSTTPAVVVWHTQ